MNLQLQRRHTGRCPDRAKGLHFMKCKGKCPFRIVGRLTAEQAALLGLSVDSEGRVRQTLKVRDLDRANRILTGYYNKLDGAPAAAVAEAVERVTMESAVKAYLEYRETRRGAKEETIRKYRRVLGYLQQHCATHSIEHVADVDGDLMNAYEDWRNKHGWTWNNEASILKGFFTYCIEKRKWIRENPAAVLEAPEPKEPNQVVPFTSDEIIAILKACDTFGAGAYERLRARAMTLVLRYTGVRISDLVTLSREHIVDGRVLKPAVKNGKMIRVMLLPEVIQALEMLPQPRGASASNQRFFAVDHGKVRSLVKGAWRTLDAVFEKSGVEGAHPHRFRHTLASDLLAKGVPIGTVADILADTEQTIRKHYEKWVPERQALSDEAIRKLSGTKRAQSENASISALDGEVGVVARDGIEPPTRGFSVRCSTS